MRVHEAVAVGGAVLVCSCALLVLNIYPYRGGQNHGWPLVYIVRQSRPRVGDLSVFYGPWPLDDPPLVEFYTPSLIGNILVAALILPLAASVLVYWLRWHRPGMQFSLRGLLALMTLVAFEAAMLPLLAEAIELDWVGCVLNAAFWAVYAPLAGALLTAGHFLVLRGADSPRRVRWWELHWLTWLAILAVAVPLLNYTLFSTTGIGWAPADDITAIIAMTERGWPLPYCGLCDEQDQWAFKSLVRYFDPMALLADGIVSTYLIASTAFVAERWIRRTELRVRLRVHGVVALGLVVMGVIAVHLLDSAIKAEGYAYAAWLVAVMCGLFTAGAICIAGLTKLSGDCGRMP